MSWVLLPLIAFGLVLLWGGLVLLLAGIRGAGRGIGAMLGRISDDER